MAEFKGYIYLHRKIIDNFLWESDERFDKRSAWIDLLLAANHSEKEVLFNGSVMKVNRGQLLTSQRKLAARWHWHHATVNRYINMLKNAEMIYFDATRGATLITIRNYEEYQDISRFNRGNNAPPSAPPSAHPTAHSVAHTLSTDATQTINVINDNEIEIKEKNGAAPSEGFKRWS